MKRQHRSFILGASAALILTSLSSDALAGSINTRRENQQQRIAQGASSGQLTPRETAHLERQEARLNHEIRAMRSAHGGQLTPQDRAVIDRRQNHLSKEIYREKHDYARRY